MKTIVRSFVWKLFFFLPESLISSIVFEAVAFLGNLFASPIAFDINARNFINLGSGPQTVPGYINIDFFSTPGIDYGADLRRKLKISDNVVDGIFCEHTIEHLTYTEASRLMDECFRILKPGGVVRIIVPDIGLFIDKYVSADELWFKRWEQLMFADSSAPDRTVRQLETPMQAISFVTQEYGHVSAWDARTLMHFLKKSGFNGVTLCSFRQGQCSKLLLDLDAEDRKFVSLYIEAVK